MVVFIKRNNMKPNHLKFDSKNSDLNYREKTFSIKFGARYYQIQENQIAYIYKSEGLIFLVNNNDEKFPVSVLGINEIFLDLNPHQFFKISNTVIFNRDAIVCFKVKDEYLHIILISDLNSTLKLSVSLKENFKEWFTNKSKILNHETKKSNIVNF